jgi:hypothetical protein
MRGNLCPGNRAVPIPYDERIQAFLSWFGPKRLLPKPDRKQAIRNDFNGDGMIAPVEADIIQPTRHCSEAPTRRLPVLFAGPMTAEFWQG